MDDINQKQNLEKVYKKAASSLQRSLNLFNPENYTPEIVRGNKDVWVKEVKDALLAVDEASIDLEDLRSNDEKREANAAMKNLENDVSKFIFDINAKALANSIPARGASVEAKKEAEVSFGIDLQKFSDGIESMSRELNEFDDWSKATSNEVEAAIGKIPEWKKQINEITNVFYSMKKTAKLHDLEDPDNPEDSLKTSENAMNLLKDKFETVLEELLFEDKSRCLYSLVKSKPANVSYPTFSGSMKDDFFKFKDEVEDAFESNQVRREDRVKILREHLQSTPRTLIPESMRNIDDAWKILEEMFGDPVRITMTRMVKLKNFGPYPYPNSKDRKRVEIQLKWLIEMELLVKDVIAYGENGNPDVYNSVFNPGTWKAILQLFPRENVDRMIQFDGSTEEKLTQFYRYVIELRDNAKRAIQADPFGDSGSVGDPEDAGGYAANYCCHCGEYLDECVCSD